MFFEGPPTANGRPGIHHVFSRTIKDLFCRYRAMKGYRVARKAGWDTHGLPVEIEVEKQLGISGKQQIEALGVARVQPAAAARACSSTARDWEKLSARMGYWLDYEHPYVTYTNDYVESVWWALKTLFDKNLLYRGHKILPYCPRCGTALSSHEVALGYQDDEDPSVYVALDLVEAPSGRDAALHPTVGRRILVWTTTPWTLVSNTALAVHPDLDYVELVRREDGEGSENAHPRRVARARRARRGLRRIAGRSVRAHHGRAISSGRATGARSTGSSIPAEGEHEVIVGEEFVSADDGSGVVHMSPAFGADDYAAGKRHNLAFLQPVNARGEFPASMPLVGGLFVKDADAADHRGAQAARRALEGGDASRTVSALLALRHAAHLLRAHVVVRAHDGVPRRDAGAQRARRLASAGDRRGPLRRMADEQHRLGDLARSLLGDAAAGLDLRRAIAAHVECIGSFAELSARAGARAAADFDPHKPNVDRYTWLRACRVRRHDAPRARGDRHLVRLGLDVVRAVALSVREPRQDRRPVPGGFHRRGRRPDARMVLLAARDRDGTRRRAAEQRRTDGRRERDAASRRRIAPSS